MFLEILSKTGLTTKTFEFWGAQRPNVTHTQTHYIYLANT